MGGAWRRRWRKHAATAASEISTTAPATLPAMAPMGSPDDSPWESSPSEVDEGSSDPDVGEALVPVVVENAEVMGWLAVISRLEKNRKMG